MDIVPWTCKKEWIFCRNKLYGDDLLMKQKAVGHLHIWKTRCLNLPIAVECTLILMDVHTKGSQLNEENEEILFNTMNFELMYSMAIMRFLNFVTDSNVGDKPFSSLNQVAKELGIPEWIVEIRHTAAHGQSLPSLSVLRQAAEFCLQWLYDSYWNVDNFEDAKKTETEDSFNYVLHCFEVCLRVKEHLLAGIENILDLDFTDKEKVRRVFTKKIFDDEIRFRNCNLADIYKIILKKLSRQIRKDPKNGQLLVDKLIQNDHLISLKMLNTIEADQEVIRWSDILTTLCNSSSCLYLLQNLVNITTAELEENWRKKCAAIYLDKIFEKFVKPQRNDDGEICINDVSRKRKKTDKKKKNDKQGTIVSNLNLSSSEKLNLLKTVLRKPTQFTKIFLKHLLHLQEPPMQSTKCNQLFELIDIYTRNIPENLNISKTDSDTSTLESFLGRERYQSFLQSVEINIVEENVTGLALTEITENASSVITSKTDEIFAWKKCSGDWNWSETPLGVLPWQTDFKPWLILYD